MATKKKSSARKYSPAAGKQVETEMREFKQGKLKSGRSGKKVTNPQTSHCHRSFRGSQERCEGTAQKVLATAAQPKSRGMQAGRSTANYEL